MVWQVGDPLWMSQKQLESDANQQQKKYMFKLKGCEVVKKYVNEHI